MSEHTLGRLAYRPEEFDDWGFLRDDQGHLVAVAMPGGLLTDEEISQHQAERTDPAEANARRLALIWNCHDALVEALKIARDGLRWGATDREPSMAIRIIDEALAQAKGG